MVIPLFFFHTVQSENLIPGSMVLYCSKFFFSCLFWHHPPLFHCVIWPSLNYLFYKLFSPHIQITKNVSFISVWLSPRLTTASCTTWHFHPVVLLQKHLSFLIDHLRSCCFNYRIFNVKVIKYFLKTYLMSFFFHLFRILFIVINEPINCTHWGT